MNLSLDANRVLTAADRTEPSSTVDELAVAADLKRTETVLALRELEKARMGWLVVGRRGHQSRFEWRKGARRQATMRPPAMPDAAALADTIPAAPLLPGPVKTRSGQYQRIRSQLESIERELVAMERTG
jgi:hypothetical protein